jgi:hypothetical protein
LNDYFSEPQSARAGLPAATGGDAPVPPRSIVVNGRQHLVRSDRIDHEQLVRLAFPDGRGAGTRLSSLTVTYRGGPYHAAEGILAPRERTPVADGETFFVIRTDKG